MYFNGVLLRCYCQCGVGTAGVLAVLWDSGRQGDVLCWVPARGWSLVLVVRWGSVAGGLHMGGGVAC